MNSHKTCIFLEKRLSYTFGLKCFIFGGGDGCGFDTFCCRHAICMPFASCCSIFRVLIYKTTNNLGLTTPPPPPSINWFPSYNESHAL